MPAISFSERKFVKKIEDMYVFTTFRLHTRDPPRLKVGDLVTCFFKQRAKKICRNCLNFSSTDSLGNGLCMQDERAWAENTCDEFNKIICNAQVMAVELFEIRANGIHHIDGVGVKWDIYPPKILELANLDKFNSTEEFFEFFNNHYDLPQVFDRYTLEKLER